MTGTTSPETEPALLTDLAAMLRDARTPKVEVLKDHPTPRGRSSAFAPAWIIEIVRRQDEASAVPAR